MKRLSTTKKMNFIYTNREERGKYTVLKYREYLKGKILDVECWNRGFKKYLDKDIKYVGIDIAGNPDVFVDLEKGKIPFLDNSFNCVVSTDVLEHFDNIHDVLDESIRVSKKYIILSLPNNWCVIKGPLILGKGRCRFFGLPINKPKDRHKWFFNYN